ncbi:hypothetical protein LCGC14_0146670 [marine sediment metagenome]|uniref:Uncharacterized protein n=1 Tax=marine sediment metagenome TaxID=412755 RepID=A0A0F9V011_9ZZZZ
MDRKLLLAIIFALTSVSLRLSTGKKRGSLRTLLNKLDRFIFSVVPVEARGSINFLNSIKQYEYRRVGDLYELVDGPVTLLTTEDKRVELLRFKLYRKALTVVTKKSPNVEVLIPYDIISEVLDGPVAAQA